MDKYKMDSSKLLWHMHRINTHFREGERISPILIDIGITKFCNAKCIYCYGVYQQLSTESIPAEVLNHLFREAPECGVKAITLTGDGENTLNEGLWEALKIGKLEGLDIGLATNGIALNPGRIKRIILSCTWLRFNLSGMGEEGYKSIHGVSQWKRVRANILTAIMIKRALGSECTIGLQMVLIPKTFEFILPEVDFAIQEGLDYFVIKQFSDPGDARLAQFNLDWYNKPHVIERMKYVESLSTTSTQIIPKWDAFRRKGQRKYDHCVDCALLFQVSGNGKCYPCGYLFNNEKYCYGDLKSQSFKEIIESEKYWDIVKYMRSQFNVHKECKGACRHDSTNEFVWKYLHPPAHINFI